MTDVSRWRDKINPFNDYIDTREVIDRIEEIESEYRDDDGEPRGIGAWSEDHRAEWTGLTGIIGDVGEIAAGYGVTLIRESSFEDRVKEDFSEIGGEFFEWDDKAYTHRRIPLDELYSRMPFSCIDWERVAEECRPDYSTLEFDDVTYYYIAD